MSWQMPGGINIKDPSLVIISAIGDEDKETLSFIFNVNSILLSGVVWLWYFFVGLVEDPLNIDKWLDEDRQYRSS